MKKTLKMLLGIGIVSLIVQVIWIVGNFLGFEFWRQSWAVESNNQGSYPSLYNELWIITLRAFYQSLPLVIVTVCLLVYGIAKYKKRPSNNTLYVALFFCLVWIFWVSYQVVPFFYFDIDFVKYAIKSQSSSISISDFSNNLINIRFGLIALQLFLIIHIVFSKNTKEVS